LTPLLLAAGMIGAAEIGERFLGLPPPAWGAPPHRSALDGLAAGLVLGGVVCAAVTLLGLGPHASGPLFRSVLLAPLAEERLFRGFLGRAIGGFPSALLFAAAHGARPVRFLALVTVGLVLWRAFERHGLAASVGLHAGMNLSVTEL
jgi:membrane protease YdiL (CAAX protease family)